MKEISKEEKEKSLKNTWEENEPGRAEKAKISRKKYFIEKVKKEGGKLTPEQMELINSKTEAKDNASKRASVVKKRKSRVSIMALNKKSGDKKSGDEKEIKNLETKKKIYQNQLKYYQNRQIIILNISKII